MYKKLFLAILISPSMCASEGVTALSSGVAAGFSGDAARVGKENEKSYSSLSTLISAKKYGAATQLLDYVLANMHNGKLEQDERWLKAMKKEVQNNLERLSALREATKEQKNLFILLVKVQIAFKDFLPDSVIINMQDRKFPQTMKKAFAKLGLDTRYVTLANNEEMRTISTKKQKPAAKAEPPALTQPMQRVPPTLTPSVQTEAPIGVAAEDHRSEDVKVARRLSFTEGPHITTFHESLELQIAAQVPLPDSPETDKSEFAIHTTAEISNVAHESSHENHADDLVSLKTEMNDAGARAVVPEQKSLKQEADGKVLTAKGDEKEKSEILERSAIPEKRPVIEPSVSPIKRWVLGSVCLALAGIVGKKIYDSRTAKSS